MNTMQERNIQHLSTTQKIVKFGVKFGTYAFLAIMAVIVIFPFYWMIISSMKTMNEYRLSIPTLFPRFLDIMNYAEVFANEDLLLGQLFYNTLLVGVVSTVLSLIITVLSAFAFARLVVVKNVCHGKFGETVFLTREEAEEALRRMEENE